MKPRSALGEELYNVWLHEPLWAGDTLGGKTIRELARQGLVRHTEHGYVLTDKGRALIEPEKKPPPSDGMTNEI